MPFQKTKLAVKGLLIFGTVLLAGRCFWAWQTVTHIAATVECPLRMEFGPLGEAGLLGRAVRKHVRVDRWFPSSLFDVAFLPVRECEISSFRRMPGDLGSELRAFQHLKKIHIGGSGSEVSEADWQRLISRIRQAPELVEFELYGDQITDAAIAHLEGHPRLQTLTIMEGRLTAGSLKTFRSLPKLRGLYIFGNAARSDVATTLSSEDLTGAMPNVRIEYSIH